jgi:serine/threonine protein kinase HipA of HipAB toxin-antitoxin module
MKDRRQGEEWEFQDQEEYHNEPKKSRTTNIKEDQDDNVGRKRQQTPLEDHDHNELKGEASPKLEERMTLRMKRLMKIRGNPKQEEKV